MTPERFAQLIVSDAVVNRIKEYRRRLPEMRSLTPSSLTPDPSPIGEGSGYQQEREQERESERERKREMRKIMSIKSGLPVIMYQATFDETVSKKGFKGRWRKQAAARLNGLFMLDVDHVENPQALFNGWLEAWGKKHYDSLPDEDKMRLAGIEITTADLKSGWAQELGILLVHITPSGKGIRIVAKADASIGNIADNQAHLSQLLGVEPDAACKDASRCSFCPGFEDILYINKSQLFNYDNPEYDEKFGPQYRGGSSQPTAARAAAAADRADVPARPATTGAAMAEGAAGQGAPLDGKTDEGTAHNVELMNGDYRGKSYEDIAEQWFRTVLGGTPKAGDRHQSLYRLACDLRYITDFDPELLARVLEVTSVGKDIAEERGREEIARIAADACAAQRWRTIPQRFQKVLAAVGIQLDGQADDRVPRKSAEIDYDYWWQRLAPLLGDAPGYREAVAQLPERLRMGGVLAAGAMLGTYLTRAWWEHFDGKDYRLSFLVYIVGSAASGKSFITELDRLIMAPMQAADRVGREWERKYKEDMKKRAASTKNAKAEAPEQQHPVIRYVPSSVSNAMLYRRLTDAIDNDCTGPDMQPMHLHCYTCEPELATALRAQQGSWAGKNDLELKSFHNEYAGVDFANDQSVNGIIQVNWNQVVSGTQEAMNRKVKPATVLDGLVTRLALFLMPSNDFQMIERREAIRDHEREELLRSIGLKLEQVKGELACQRLVDYCYDYERRLTDEARIEQDYCLDYFRKRIPVIMMRYTLVRIVCRQIDAAINGEQLQVADDDLEFACLIGDWCLMAQMHLFGQMVMEAQERENGNFVPMRRQHSTRDAYATLPMENITPALLVQMGIRKELNSAGALLSKWAAEKLVTKMSRGVYNKKYKEIPL